MVFFQLLEWIAVLLVFTFFLFQIIIPIWKGTLLFPICRIRARNVDKQLRQAKSDLELSKEEELLENMKPKEN